MSRRTKNAVTYHRIMSTNLLKSYIFVRSKIQNLFLISSIMSRSINKRIQSQGILTDRTKARSTDKQAKGLTYTREIVIRTQEPDIPQITILKVQRVQQGEASQAFQLLLKLFQRARLKRLFKGFNQICGNYQSFKIAMANVVKLANILKSRDKRIMKIAWGKLLKLKFQYPAKINSCRLFWKLFSVSSNKSKSDALKKINQYVLSRTKRSVTEIVQPTSKKADQSLELQLAKLKSQQFSQKFMTVCKKFIKYNNKKFIQAAILELQPNTAMEIERYQQLRKNQGLSLNNQTVLIVLNNQIIAIKDLKKDLEANQSIVKEFQKEDAASKLAFYQQAEHQFQKADNEIRVSFDKQNKIDQKQLSKILESQLLKWNRLKQHSVYGSRLFISALVVRVMKDGTVKLNDYLNILQNFLRLCTDVKRIQQFKKNLTNEERSSSILIQIANKFIDLNTFGMPPIMEKGFSENQQDFMSEIKYIRQEMKDFILKFNNPLERKKLKKTFSTKKAKAPEQLRELYSTINELIGLIQKSSVTQTKAEPQSQKKVEMILKIVQQFTVCLKQGNYQKWETFLNKQVSKEEYKTILNLLDQINDILNDKINEESKNVTQELKKSKEIEHKLRQEITNMKTKITDLEKARKTSQGKQSKKQDESEENMKKLLQWQLKYNQLSAKFEKLQKQQRTSESRINYEQQTNILQKKLEQKDKQINKLKESISSKDKIEIKDYNQIKQINLNLNRKVTQLTQKLQYTVEQLESRQVEMKNMRTNLSQDQNNQILIEQLKNENQAMNRKMQMMANTIQSISQELVEKKKVIQQLERNINLGQQGKKPTRNDKNMENSMQLIRQLNSQLQKLKRSQISLQQINKELQNVHGRGQDVQITISRMESQNNQLKINLAQKDRLIWELKMEINRLSNQVSLFNSQIYTLETELNDKNENIKRLQNLMRENESMFHKEIANKKDYILKLEGIISNNEKNMADFNMQIQKLKRESEGNQNTKIQSELQRRLSELRQALSKISSLEYQLSQFDKKYQLERKSWTESQTIINNNERKYQQEKKRWQDERQKWSIDKIRLQKQVQRRAIQINRWQADKAAYNNDRQRLEVEWRNFIVKYEQATGQNSRLLSQLTELNNIIAQLRYEIQMMGSNSINIDNIVWLLANITSSFIRIQPKPTPEENQKTSHQIFVDLTAIKEKYASMQEDMFQNLENYIVSFIQSDIGKYRFELSIRIDQLSALKERLIEFLNNEIDISKRSLTYQYNYELKQSTIAATAAKSSFETPAKSLDKSFKISQQIKEIKEKTLHARQLF